MTKGTFFTIHNTRDLFYLIVIYTTVHYLCLRLVIEPIPEMKYRRRTGENSRRPERVENMGSLTSVSKSSRTELLTSKGSTPQSQSGLVFMQIIPSNHNDNNWATNTSSSLNKLYVEALARHQSVHVCMCV